MFTWVKSLDPHGLFPKRIRKLPPCFEGFNTKFLGEGLEWKLLEFQVGMQKIEEKTWISRRDNFKTIDILNIGGTFFFSGKAPFSGVEYWDAFN